MSWRSDTVRDALDAIGIQSLDDMVDTQTRQDIAADDYMGDYTGNTRGIVDSHGHHFSGSQPVYDTTDLLTDTNDVEGLPSRVKSMYSDEGNFWDEEEAYLGDVMRDYERDYFGSDDRDDSPAEYACAAAGGTWNGGTCVMPTETPEEETGPTEEEIFINSFDPFTSINRTKWMHPLAGYDGTSNLWGYQPPQLEDWTPGLRDWAAGD